MEQKYPRLIELEDTKLKKLLVEKSQLVEAGRAISEEIEGIEIEMDGIDKKIQELEKQVDISDIMAQEKVITERFEAIVKEMELLKNRIYERMNEQVPKENKLKYDELRKTKGELEEKRNRIALKVQKKNDKIIPISQKLMKPLLQDEYEDFDTIRIENGKVVGTIFSHLDDFKKRHLEKSKK